MASKSGFRFIVAGLLLAAFVQPGLAARKKRLAVRALPAVSGLAASHDMRWEGGRLCFLDHYHYGSSLGASSKKGAEIAAVESWAGFVNFEYGGEWDNFGRSASKDMRCSQSGAGWGCELSARPCR